jgi:hypothetical protein
MRVIFLDIDGVLNCSKTKNPRDFPYLIDRKLLKRFKALVRRTKARVVLSSTWRVDPIGLYAAKYYGVPFNDVCPDMPNRPRSDEIRSWLSHKRVSRFVDILLHDLGADGARSGRAPPTTFDSAPTGGVSRGRSFAA